MRTSTSWTKGQSGNPGGRPKALHDVQELARAHTSDAIETLSAIMCDTEASDAARVSAANALLDRAWGKPMQAVEQNITHGSRSAEDMTDDELAAIASGVTLELNH